MLTHWLEDRKWPTPKVKKKEVFGLSLMSLIARPAITLFLLFNFSWLSLASNSSLKNISASSSPVLYCLITSSIFSTSDSSGAARPFKTFSALWSVSLSFWMKTDMSTSWRNDQDSWGCSIPPTTLPLQTAVYCWWFGPKHYPQLFLSWMAFFKMRIPYQSDKRDAIFPTHW